jgi:hypothetical protein
MTEIAESNPTTLNGVVTFLDVLGWKGIWQRKQNPIYDLEQLVKSISKKSQLLSRGIKLSDKEITETKVMIISDTIVIFTESTRKNATNTIDLHGSLCIEAIPLSITKGIPLRGATSYGEVIISSNNSIYAGKAIDEAAAWHELGDWIGVFMSPTANFVYEPSASGAWIQYQPPLKGGKKLTTYTVDWNKEKNEEDIKTIKQSFCELAPITPEIESKFSNTIEYLSKSIA